MSREIEGFVANRIGIRKKEIREEIYNIISSNVPTDIENITKATIEQCMRDCTKLKREYQSLTTAYNLFFVTPYNGG